MRATKRDELVEKALATFYRNGFHATGMDRLVAETGISKTSMYKHFRTKEDLILAALRLRDERFRTWLYGRMEALADTPARQLLAAFDALGEWFRSPDFHGCMFVKANAEYQQADHPIRSQATEHKRLIVNHFTTLAAGAGARRPEDLAEQLVILKEGAIAVAAIGLDMDAAGQARRIAEGILDRGGIG